MTTMRLLIVATAYCVVLLEVYSGAINGPIWWVLPGVLVLSLIGALSAFGERGGEGTPMIAPPTPGRWIVIMLLATAMSGFAYYFGREIIPDILVQPA